MSAILGIGAGIAVLTGLGAGIGIGIANRQGNRSSSKTAGGRRQDFQAVTWLCTCRSNRYLRFRYRYPCNYVLEISRKVGKDYA